MSRSLAEWIWSWGVVVLLLAAVTPADAGAAASAGETPEAASDILALSPEMAEFIDSRVRQGQTRHARVRALMDALFGKDGLDVVYGSAETKTAVETFETRSGNCLSFTLLFVALARHLELETSFHEVSEILSWDRRGDVAVSNRHMFAEIETIEGPTRVDFLPGVEKRYRSVRRIGERRVLAHYYSNLGAEALTEEKFEHAMELFGKALAADPTVAAAWVNMGVTHRRLGQLDEAEAAYLRALEINPREMSAVSNLASLYESTERERLAEPYLRLLRRHRRSNPFWFFRLGLEAGADGDLELAMRRFKRAVELLPEDPMFRAELGKIQARAGRQKKARRSYLRALELATDDSQRSIIEELLASVEAAA